ncbi:hypothetical protein COT50_00795 [candidate division WWE3 bacterium CG08_land_8_20_14_0_20_41_10]|uniref:Uncharacterized protein n=2 Tax=Bacteria candidate phyla TaxID=1783234 RepID=A0A2H0XEU5_UNCKA|nr:MAG: hypothetical protein COX35_02280 [Candidatus Nealsonbacteria bacterium CG23_combo_of_CG06-09_8_20_14_all_37_18]PIS22638.1 MAG: hypothetical protein COT50_00795 [candidate division WWE3 bacterium CG08_land_8_20_14_0_20_41_10]
MILILRNKATKEEVDEVTKAYRGYAKVVVDVEQEILSAGGEYHIDCEQVLINNGGSQENLWGGGFKFENKEIDFMGLTNYKSHLKHLSYEVTFPEIREKMEKVIRRIFDYE